MAALLSLAVCSFGQVATAPFTLSSSWVEPDPLRFSGRFGPSWNGQVSIGGIAGGQTNILGIPVDTRTGLQATLTSRGQVGVEIDFGINPLHASTSLHFAPSIAAPSRVYTSQFYPLAGSAGLLADDSSFGTDFTGFGGHIDAFAWMESRISGEARLLGAGGSGAFSANLGSQAAPLQAEVLSYNEALRGTTGQLRVLGANVPLNTTGVSVPIPVVGSIDFTNPRITTSSDLRAGRFAAAGQSNLVRLNVDLDGLLTSGLEFINDRNGDGVDDDGRPGLSFPSISGSVSVGPIQASYDLLNAEFRPSLALGQTVDMTPRLGAVIRFDRPVEFEGLGVVAANTPTTFENWEQTPRFRALEEGPVNTSITFQASGDLTTRMQLLAVADIRLTALTASLGAFGFSAAAGPAFEQVFPFSLGTIAEFQSKTNRIDNFSTHQVNFQFLSERQGLFWQTAGFSSPGGNWSDPGRWVTSDGTVLTPGEVSTVHIVGGANTLVTYNNAVPTTVQSLSVGGQATLQVEREMTVLEGTISISQDARLVLAGGGERFRVGSPSDNGIFAPLAVTKLTGGGAVLVGNVQLRSNENRGRLILDDIHVVMTAGEINYGGKQSGQGPGYIDINRGGHLEFLGGELVLGSTDLATVGVLALQGGRLTTTAVQMDSFLTGAGFVFTSGVLQIDDITFNEVNRLNSAFRETAQTFRVRPEQEVLLSGRMTIRPGFSLALEDATVRYTELVNEGMLIGSGLILGPDPTGFVSPTKSFVRTESLDLTGVPNAYLLSKESATLRSHTTLAGGRLAAPSGLIIDSGGDLSGHGTIGGDLDIALGGVLRMAGGNLTIDDLNSQGRIELDQGQLTAGSLTLGGRTTMAGANITAAGGVTLTGSLTGSGRIDAPIVSTPDSSLTLEGSMVIGLPSTTAGVSLAGGVNVGAHRLELRDSDRAQLAGVATLAGGELTANGFRGIRLEPGASLRGHGTVSTRFDVSPGATLAVSGGPLTVGAFLSDGFNSSGLITVDDQILTIRTTREIDLLAGKLSLAGGTVIALEQPEDATRARMNLYEGAVLEGFGAIDANFRGFAGSLIRATGDLTIGFNDFTGFGTAGTLDVGSHRVTLVDSTVSAANGLVLLDGGQIIAPKGLNLNDAVIRGYGVISGEISGVFTVEPQDSGESRLSGVLTVDPGDEDGPERVHRVISPSLARTQNFSPVFTGGVLSVPQGLEMADGLVRGHGTLQGPLVIAGAVTILLDESRPLITQTIDVLPGGSLDVRGGTLQIGDGASDGSMGSGTISIGEGTMLAFNRADNLTAGNLISGFGSIHQIGSGTTTLTGANLYSGATIVEAGELVLALAAQTPVVSGAGGAEIRGGRLVLEYSGAPSPAGAIVSLLTGSYQTGFASGQFRSGAASASSGLGWLDATTSSRFIIGYAFYGDADLDGRVDVTDLGALATNWQAAGVWSGGDFNYDGMVDVADLGSFATNWQAGVTGPTAPHASLQAALSSVGLSGVVPEPAGLSLLAAGALGLRRRR